MKDDIAGNSFFSRNWLQFTLAAVAVSRLPLLRNGYGSDPDAWRAAYVGQMIWKTGSYEMSRPPGYPLHELVSAPLVALGGSLLSNAATIIAMLILVAVFARWAVTSAQHPRLVTLALAFLPLLWMNSATTMDYTWSLLFIVLSLSAIGKGNVIGGGLLTGIAAGFRSANIIVVIPFCIMIWMKHRSSKRLVQFLAGSVIATTAAFVPVMVTYGFAGWLQLAQSQLARVKPDLPRDFRT